ncbi:MAG TPA: fluoride efflux transporter CrcB [Cytophagaceae bacterium]|nr:fluoride efflux transporter CrcB [Cytophagaceae bacterium]
MKKTILLIGIGGAIGSIVRYLITTYFSKLFPSQFPYGTFFVNITGCFLIGIIFGLSERFNWTTSDWRIFLTAGICGGYTTFSAFTFENMKLLQASEYLMFSINTIGSFVLGLLFVFIGLAITKV